MDAPNRLHWVESAGGPLILVSRAQLGAWGGDDRPERGPTDYARAASIGGNSGAIPVGGADALVLSGEPLPTAWWQPDMVSAGMFVRWIAAYRELDVLRTLSQLLGEAFQPSAVTLSLRQSEYLLFDAAMPGDDILTPSAAVTIEPGDYRVDTMEAVGPNRAQLMLHRLVRLERSALRRGPGPDGQ